MSHKNPRAEQAELSLITADTEFFLNLVLNPDLEPIRWLGSLALVPYLSAYVYESAKHIEQTKQSSAQILQTHGEQLLTSRMKVKQIEDKYRSSAEVLENANELININSGWFLNAHHGILGPLKRLLQADLGVYFIQDEIITTTHIAFLNLGLTKEALSDSSLTFDNLGPHMRDRMVDVGRYVGQLITDLGIDPEDRNEIKDPLPAVEYRDVKSQRLYEQIARQAAPNRRSVSILLTWLLSQVNTARVLVPIIKEKRDAATFKVRFVSLFQTILSLHKLLEEERETSFLEPHAVEKISLMLDDNSVKSVYENKSLRNNLVHYGVPKRIAPKLSADLPLFGLVEAHSAGKSFRSMNRDVALGLDRISEGIQALLPRTLTPNRTI